MATRAKQQYYGDGNNIVKNKRTFELSQDILDKIEEAGVGTIETIKVNGITQPVVDKTVNIPVPLVEDSLNSYSTTNALSANQGRLLQDAINNFQTIGHFLSLWNAETGLPVDEPSTSPYVYNTGDYYIVSNIASRNFRPDGSEYVSGQASSVEETADLAVNDFYFFNGTHWFHLSNEGKSLAIDDALSTSSTNAVENRVVTNALNGKANVEDLENFYTKTEVDEKIDDAVQDNVKDGVLTIQKNGADQGTFSANQATNTTINLTVNKIDVGLSNVDNTSDADKPISTATQTALDGLSDRIDALETGDIQDIKDDVADLQENKLDKTDLGDATLTVQKNGTDVGTFTANSKTDTTINLELTKADVGLGNVDNTADIDKPISTATQEALDEKADKTELNNYYTKTETYSKTEVDSAIDDALADGVSDATITITQGGETKGTFTLNQAGDATIALDAGSDDGMEYPDFEFVTKTGSDIELSISSKVVEPTANFTINAPSEIKDGITYVLRVQNGATPPAMSLGTNITNPYNVDLSLSENKTDTFAFLAIDGKLELQPTEAEVPENVYTKEEVNTLLEDKADKIDLDNYYTKTEVGLALADKADKFNTYTKTETDDLLDAKVDDTDLTNYYDRTEVDAALDAKQDTLTAGTGIAIENNVISADGVGDVMYDDFKFVEMTGNTFENLSGYKTINANTNLLSGTNLKEGMQYVLYVTNEDTAAHMVTVDGVNQVEIPAGETKTLVYLATASHSLELQTCEGGGGGGETPGNGTITITQGGETKGTFTVNQSADTTIELDAGSEDAMEYPDFNFVDKTGTAITLDLNSTITPVSNFTVNTPTEIKDGQIYVLRVDVGAATFTMTLGEGITNPYNVDLSLGTNTLSQFVFLAVDGVLELQPQLMTRVDVENILREYNLIP